MKHPLLAINVGNTRTTFAVCGDDQVLDSESLGNDSLSQSYRSTVERLLTQLEIDDSFAVVLASTNSPVATRVVVDIETLLNRSVHRSGRDLVIPIGRHLDSDAKTGEDRLLNAAAAFDGMKQACIIIDAGTAVTVDFVDGEGTFHGGAILPGARTMLRSMHTSTAALPEIAWARPTEPLGHNTEQAMLTGVFHGIRGAIRELTEVYAVDYGAYPKIIATGGDAELLFKDYDLVESIVPDLTLRGLMVTWKTAVEALEDE